MIDKGGSLARTKRIRNRQRSSVDENEPNKDLDNIKLTDESDNSVTDPDEPPLIGELTE